MISTGNLELMSFSYPTKSFFEDNLLDADDWRNDVSLDDENHSPDSLSPLNVDQLQYFPDFSSNSNSLQYDCLDSFLSNSKLCLLEENSPEEQIPPVNISPVSCNEKIAVNNNSIPFTNPCVSSSTKQTSTNSVQKVPCNDKRNVPLTPTKKNVQNILKMKKLKPICVKKEPDLPVIATPCTNPFTSPTVVKLDNGQFYVDYSIEKPAVITNVNNLNNSKINYTKRGSVQLIHGTSKDVNEIRKFKREQRMVKNRESACLSRQRKKDHLKKLESCVTEISTLNEHLQEENDMLKQRIQSLENENSVLREKCSDTLKDKAKKSGVLFVIVFLFIFNVIGSPDRRDIIETSNQQEEGIPYQKEFLLPNKLLTFHSRSLLQYVNSNVKQDEYYLHPNQKTYNSNLMNELFTSRSSRNNDHDNSYHNENNDDNDFENNDNNIKKETLRNKRRDKSQNSRDELDSVDCGEQFNETYIKRINNALNGLVKGLREENKKSKLSKKLFKKGRKITPINNSSLTKIGKGNTDNCTHRKHHYPCSHFIKNYKIGKYETKFPKRDSLLNLTSQELANVIQRSIDRKPDTFYVVTSWKDFLTVLPSTNNSNFHLPKVSFMIPAFHPKNNGTFDKDSNKLSMLKIDCNVIDTTLLKLDQNMLSKSLITRL